MRGREANKELMTLREQIDSANEQQRAINERKQQLLDGIAAREMDFRALAERVALGDETALKRSLQLRREAGDMAIQIESVDIAMTELEVKRAALNKAWLGGGR